MSEPHNPYISQGYLPPAQAYVPQPLPDGAPDPLDPLVNPPHSGINGWFTRIGDMFRRSWKSMLAIFAITYLLPMVGLAVITVIATVGLSALFLSGADIESQTFQDMLPVGIPVLIAIVLVLVIAFLIVQSAGYAAATYAVTKEAAGQRIGLGEALGYGFRRALGLTGWQILVGLIAGLGFLACILPGVYLYAATALFGPIFLFERRSPIGRSVGIFNQNLGRILGRLALLFCATIVAALVTGIFDQIGAAIAGTSNELGVLLGSAALSSVLSILIELPVTMLIFSGILLTYAEQRGYEGPASTSALAAEL